MIKGDTLVSRGGLSYSAFRSLFLHFDRFLSHKCVPQVSSICRGPSWRFKMGSPSAASCAGVGGDEEWKVIQERLYIIYIIHIQKRPSDSKHLNWSSMEPPHCFQPMYDPPFFKGSEDCLYLNVFTPMVKRGVLRNKQSRLSFFFKHQWWNLFPPNRRRQNI